MAKMGSDHHSLLWTRIGFHCHIHQCITGAIDLEIDITVSSVWNIHKVVLCKMQSEGNINLNQIGRTAINIDGHMVTFCLDSNFKHC